MELYVCRKKVAKKSILLVLVLVVLPVFFGGCAWMKERAVRDYTQARIRSTPFIVPPDVTWVNEPVMPLVVVGVPARQLAQAKPLIALPLVSVLPPSARAQPKDIPWLTGLLCLQIVDSARLAYLKIPGWRVLDIFYELVGRLSMSRRWRIIEKDERLGHITVTLPSGRLHPEVDRYVISVEKKDDSTHVVVLNDRHDPYDAKKIKSVLDELAQLMGQSCSSV